MSSIENNDVSARIDKKTNILVIIVFASREFARSPPFNDMIMYDNV